MAYLTLEQLDDMLGAHSNQLPRQRFPQHRIATTGHRPRCTIVQYPHREHRINRRKPAKDKHQFVSAHRNHNDAETAQKSVKWYCQSAVFLPLSADIPDPPTSNSIPLSSPLTRKFSQQTSQNFIQFAYYCYDKKNYLTNWQSIKWKKQSSSQLLSFLLYSGVSHVRTERLRRIQLHCPLSGGSAEKKLSGSCNFLLKNLFFSIQAVFFFTFCFLSISVIERGNDASPTGQFPLYAGLRVWGWTSRHDPRGDAGRARWATVGSD